MPRHYASGRGEAPFGSGRRGVVSLRRGNHRPPQATDGEQCPGIAGGVDCFPRDRPPSLLVQRPGPQWRAIRLEEGRRGKKGRGLVREDTRARSHSRFAQKIRAVIPLPLQEGAGGVGSSLNRPLGLQVERLTDDHPDRRSILPTPTTVNRQDVRGGLTDRDHLECRRLETRRPKGPRIQAPRRNSCDTCWPRRRSRRPSPEVS